MSDIIRNHVLSTSAFLGASETHPIESIHMISIHNGIPRCPLRISCLIYDRVPSFMAIKMDHETLCLSSGSDPSVFRTNLGKNNSLWSSGNRVIGSHDVTLTVPFCPHQIISLGSRGNIREAHLYRVTGQMLSTCEFKIQIYPKIRLPKSFGYFKQPTNRIKSTIGQH